MNENLTIESLHMQCVGGYRIDKTIGQGTLCKVKFAVNIQTGKGYAVKIFPAAFFNNEQFVARLESLFSLRHPSILKLSEVMRTDKHGYLVTEFAEAGELFAKLYVDGKLTVAKSRSYFSQLIEALLYLHSNEIVCGDVKPEDLLLDRSGKLKFSVTATCDMNTEKSLYRAPEEKATKASDVCSAGLILYSLLTGKVPKVGDMDYDGLEPEAVAFIEKIVQVDALKRLTIPQIKADPWFNATEKVVSKFEIRNVVVENLADMIEKEAGDTTAFELVGRVVRIDVQALVSGSVSANGLTSFSVKGSEKELSDKIIAELAAMNGKTVVNGGCIVSEIEFNGVYEKITVNIRKLNEEANEVIFGRLKGEPIQFLSLFRELRPKFC